MPGVVPGVALPERDWPRRDRQDFRLETKAAPRVGAAFAVLRDQPVARPDRTATWRQHVPPSGGAMRGWVAERTQGQDCGVPVSAECGDAALRRCTAHPECRLGHNIVPLQ